MLLNWTRWAGDPPRAAWGACAEDLEPWAGYLQGWAGVRGAKQEPRGPKLPTRPLGMQERLVHYRSALGPRIMRDLDRGHTTCPREQGDPPTRAHHLLTQPLLEKSL